MGGRVGTRYPWGDELGDAWPCNIWQGDFPRRNTLADGYLTTAPVRSYRPNDYGLWQVIGNVWEWCADTFSPEGGGERVLRGGSYLCHDSYCNRYRLAARSSNTPDSSMANAGFRTVTA
ncbi:formylglycine-generating enzyme required for sulfatase activity [Pseudonocardia eucalypti]|nr:formylglycine-generating enzyme required for sulfatase activity [Pseudonocardia eucalypti]